MTIGSITTSTASALQGASGSHHRHKPPSLDKTAELLGVSADDLGTELKSGKTLDDIASDKGVSSDDLLSALKTDLKANKPAGAPELSDDQLTQMATGIAAGKGPGGPGGPGRSAAAPRRRRRRRDHRGGQPQVARVQARDEPDRPARQAHLGLELQRPARHRERQPVYVQLLRGRRRRRRRRIRLTRGLRSSRVSCRLIDEQQLEKVRESWALSASMWSGFGLPATGPSDLGGTADAHDA